MSEEIKVNENKEEKCCCVCRLFKSEEFKKFLIIALGTFTGVFCALSLFVALHKPPMMFPHHRHHFRHGGPMMEHPMMNRHIRHHIHHHFRPGAHPGMPEFYKPDNMKNFEMQTPQADIPEPNTKN